MLVAPDIRQLSRLCISELSKALITERQNYKSASFELDDAQQHIIDTPKKFIRVVAPAGSGKTRTLIAKTAHILNTEKTAKVLCLTFTNAAKEEFLRRAQEMGTQVSSRICVSTLNSFGYDILKNKSLKLISPGSVGGANKPITSLMSESELWGKKLQRNLYRPILDFSDVMKGLGFDHRGDAASAEGHLEFIEALGLSIIVEDSLKSTKIEGDFRSSLLEKWLPFWKALSQKLWESKAITLEDQKYWALRQLANCANTQALFSRRGFTHILVDEFQDINILDLYFVSQVALITKAALIIVGDDDQCIYEWRGCTSQFMQKPNLFFKHLLGEDSFEEIVLEKNYRCPRNIVIHSEKLICHNNDRVEKQMIPMRRENANVKVIPLPAAFVAMNVIDELIADITEKHPDHTVAIVGRKKCQLIPIQILLTKRGTKFSIAKKLNVFSGTAFKDFRHLLQLIEIVKVSRSTVKNVDDLMALLNRVQPTPVSKKEKGEIQAWLTEQQPVSLYDAVLKFESYPGEFRSGYARCSDVSSRLQMFLEQTTVVSCLQIANEVLKGFQKDFVKSREDIFYSDPPFSHLCDLAVNYGNDFRSFLRDIDKAIERSNTNDPRDAKVEMMTAFGTKGREFDTVIVLDVNDGIWPNELSRKAGRIEEERRLFYVITTRTKNNLLLFESGRVQGKQLSTSPFIKEMELPDTAWLNNSNLEQLSNELYSQLKL